jgi:3-oxoacyl-[acyl-carrier protein] reductase
MSGKLEGKVAIVTGSSSGIGKATALRLAREGATVVGSADRNVAGGEATAEEIRKAGGRSLFVQANVSAAGNCERIAEAALSAFGRIDVLVNNAGITRRRPLEETDEEFWDLVLDTNLKSAYLLSRAVVGDMLKQGGGSVVNVSSVHAVASRKGHAAYAASKAGMVGMTRALAVEFGSRGVRFNCVVPGTIDHTLYPRSGEDVDRASWRPRASEAQVLGRIGSPDEVANVIRFLASGEASFVNGAAFTVDGGLLSMLKDGLG